MSGHEHQGEGRAQTTDELCAAAIHAGAIRVDCATGHVYALRRVRDGRPRRIGEVVNQGGYHVCTLHWHNRRCQAKVHRLIWIAAHGIPPAGYVLDHINRVKTDNRLYNLRLVTAAGNAQNRRSYGGESNPACRITAEVARQIRARHATGTPYERLAQRFSVSYSLVAKICRGLLWPEEVTR